MCLPTTFGRARAPFGIRWLNHPLGKWCFNRKVQRLYLGERISGLFVGFTCRFVYINKYVHIFESPKSLFIGCNNHIIWHGWCKWTSLCWVASTEYLSNDPTQIFLLPWQAISSSPKYAASSFLSHRVVIEALVVLLNTAVRKWFLEVLLLIKNGNQICGKAFCNVRKLQWGSESSSFCHMHLEGHGCENLTYPPMIPVVEHSPFP